MGTSLIRNTPLLGPYSRTIPRVLGGSYGGGRFLMNEVPLYTKIRYATPSLLGESPFAKAQDAATGALQARIAKLEQVSNPLPGPRMLMRPQSH